MIYFSADLHLDHDNIRKYCNRPFKTAKEMNDKIMDNWSDTVKKNDQIYILGDICMKPTDLIIDQINSLPGQKHLIIGNHDKHNLRELSKCFKTIDMYKEIKYNDLLFVLFHYPMESWNCSYHGSIHLYGHVHNSEFLNTNVVNRFNVGVDVNNFTPVSIEEIFKKRTNPTWKQER